MGSSSTRGPALLFWAQVVGNAGLFVGMLLVTRALGPSGRGTVAFLTVTALITAWIARLGVTEATVGFTARRPGERSVLLAHNPSSSALAGLAAAAVVCGTLWFAPAARPAHVGAKELAVLAFSIVAACLADAGYRLLARRRRAALVPPGAPPRACGGEGAGRPRLQHRRRLPRRRGLPLHARLQPSM